MVQPFVYATVGLPPLRTWLRVRRLRERVAMREQCARAVLNALIDGRVLKRGRVPGLWRRVAAVDRHGRPAARPSSGS